MSINRKSEQKRLIEYDRDFLRSTFVGIFWSAITERRKHGKFTLQSIADKLNINKSAISRWFSGEPPNWESDTISDVAGALNLELQIQARDRVTGQVFTASGAQTYPKPIVPATRSDVSTETDKPSIGINFISKSKRFATTSG
jgi:transcriptional regulator with XRE-family HTH domain